MFLLPRGDVEVPDTWHVDGMAGTGSHDMVVEKVRVPHRRVSVDAPPHTYAHPVGTPSMHRYPVIPFLALTASIPAVGCAHRAVALFRDLVSRRVLFGTSKIQAEKLPSRIRLAHALVESRSAELLLRSAARDIEDLSRAAEPASGADVARIRLQIAHVVRNCRDVVRDIMEASGASAHFLDNELQRLHRDIHMIAAHTIFDLDAAGEHLGHELLPNPASR
jgi:alkylation response protein AidB-like acyl-CoA dehydrogenase